MTDTLACDVVIAGTSYSGYIVDLIRNATLENPGSTVEVQFSADFPHASINPWDTVVVSEQSVQTFSGYVSHIIPSRSAGKVGTLVQAVDTFYRCQNWFVDSPYYTSGSTPNTVGYYTGYFCNLCGISYSINDTSGSSFLMVLDVPLGMRTVAEALTTLCSAGQWQMQVDTNGVLQFDHISHPSTANYNLTTVMAFEEDTNDTDTRNQVKVWGLNSSGSGGGGIIYKESRAVAGVPDTRAMVFGEPHIDTLAKATQLATAALDQWATLEHSLSPQIIGNPNIRVGQSFGYTHPQLTSGSYLDTITDLRATLGEGGYKQELTAGRRAYRYPYWPIGSVPTSGSTGGVVWETAGSSGYVQRIFYDSGYLYLIGQNRSGSFGSTRLRIEKREATSGSLVWSKEQSSSPLNIGTDIFVDTDVYAAFLNFNTFLTQYFDNAERLSNTSGSTLGSIQNVASGAQQGPWMSYDASFLYLSHGNSGVEEITKPALANVLSTAGGVVLSTQATSDFPFVDDGTTIYKINKTTGAAYKSLAHTAGAQEFSLRSGKAYILHNTGSGNWAIGRYTTGPLSTDNIVKDWEISGWNANLLQGSGNNGAHAAGKGIYIGATQLVIGMNYLYTAYLSPVDGSLVFEVTGSTNSADYFATCIQANGMYFAAGQKDGMWYVQARECP